MKQILAGAALTLIASGAIAAEPAGGFRGPDSLRLVTVAEAGQLGDDTAVKLQGHIVKALGDEKYEFRDETGTITVEIEREKWNGVEATPDTLVEIQGEIDKDWYRSGVEVEVDGVRLVQ
ncbi:Protein YgiW [Gammaproteobacteria bacterium]|nr:NirD/YgiW/YdeI family stress tolerance protein [Gammaproteobacteria bacterium]QOJ32496.1 MAG: NirD/YgiW/YdeI family stress tolerance protein [Gammaproteobacteria bacterium]CAG0939712.1 Protein YgiW [Gammaproteobacteria bacterium]